jgi:CheY-like chemotaxis protein
MDLSVLPASAAPPSKPGTLLLVDDEAHVLSSLKRLFRPDGYRILTAQSGAEGLAVLAQQAVDVILSDQRMPGMSGVDFLRQAKQLCPDTVRMTLSGYAELQSIIDAVNEGAVVKFLTKPWEDDRLRVHIAEAFRHKALADENRRLGAELGRANADLAGLNLRLQRMLAQQRDHAELLLAGAGGMHELLDSLPVALLGLDPEDLLVYCNATAAQLLPVSLCRLGERPPVELQQLLAGLEEEGQAGQAVSRVPGHPAGGRLVRVAQQPCIAWLCSLADRGGQPRGRTLVLMAADETVCGQKAPE